MAGQSLAMGEAFGKGFQYGKRKISSMSNEDFNKLDFKELSEGLATDYKDMIPSLKKSIEDSQVLQQSVFTALGQIITSIPENAKEFLQGIYADITGGTTETSGHEGLSSQIQNANLTSAFQRGQLTTVRYTPAQDPAAARQRIEDDLLGAGKTLEEINEFLSTKGLYSQNQLEKEAAALQNKARKDAETAAKLAAARAALARQATEREAALKTEQIAFEKVLATAGVVTGQIKRYAGPNSSAALERNKLIKEIAVLGKTASRQRADIGGCTSAGISSSTCSQWYQRTMVTIRGLQAKLTLILQRYRFEL